MACKGNMSLTTSTTTACEENMSLTTSAYTTPTYIRRMNWIHCTRRPWQGMKDVRQFRDGDPSCKPVGLYMAPDRKWTEWIESQNYIPRKCHRLRVTLQPSAKILEINVDTFAQVLKDYPDQKATADFPSDRRPFLSWWNIAKTYDGVYVDYNDRIAVKASQRYFYFTSDYDVRTLCVWNKNAVCLQLISE